MTHQEELNKILEEDIITPTTAINILISVAQISFEQPHLNDVDRLLISKALSCLKDKIDSGKNFLIKVK